MVNESELMKTNFYLPPDKIKQIKRQNVEYLMIATMLTIIAVVGWYSAIKEMARLINM